MYYLFILGFIFQLIFHHILSQFQYFYQIYHFCMLFFFFFNFDFYSITSFKIYNNILHAISKNGIIYDITLSSIINNTDFIYLNNNINNCHIINTVLNNLKQLQQCEIKMNESSIENNKIINNYNFIKNKQQIKKSIFCNSFIEPYSYPSNYYKLKLIIENKSSFKLDDSFKLLIKCEYKGDESNINIEFPTDNNNKLYFTINLYNYDGKDEMKYYIYLILNKNQNMSIASIMLLYLDIIKTLLYENVITFFELLYPTYIPFTQYPFNCEYNNFPMIQKIQNELKINEIIKYNIKDVNKLQLLLKNKLHNIWNNNNNNIFNNDIYLSILYILIYLYI